ncbi:carbohydrate ABC transporter substrate-binding protein, CUT1 family [Paramicrobacterium humi]|uniref:Carbohydrate ABC transporter substrate-binding protein, CUT1 family n=1 Tax=Paramicrobacterium humi TaxID=640635 RepID=A0A1H4LUS5_9MICO|nr:ABC transporter substrate-binding protein [Microbacterium humi]SEB74264.1 carbohydrate ABC transporter substrate-binding protein, CUT1 family [Microbacterium humi]
MSTSLTLNRRTLLMLGAGAGVMALVGCSGGAQGGAGAGKVEWIESRSGSEPTVKALKAVVKKYQETHPDFRLAINPMPDRPAFDQKIRLLASSNALPAMFDADPEPFFGKIAKSGAVADIGALYKEFGITDKFFPISLKYPKWDDGSLDLITLNANIEYFWYNRELFDKAGVTVPSTLEEFTEVCSRLHEAGITPIAINGKDGWPYYRYLAMVPFRRVGNDFINGLKDGDESMGSEIGLEAIRFLQKLAPFFQDGFSNTAYTDASDLFTTKKAAMFYSSTYGLPNFLNSSGDLDDAYGYFPIPPTGGADAMPTSDGFANSGVGTAVRADALTDELKDFLQFFFDNYGQIAFEQFRVIPSLRPTLNDSTPDIYRKVIEDIGNVKTYAKVWDVELDPSVNTVLGRESANLLTGQTTPEKFAARVDAAIKEAVASR